MPRSPGGEEGKIIKEIMRCLRRYVAREAYKALVTQARITSPQVADVAAASISRSGLK
jgi:hypothetical protein